MDIGYELSFQQNEMRQMSDNRIFAPLFVAGYGAGKSFILVDNAIRDILLFRGCKIGVYAPTLDLLDLNLVPAIEEQLDKRGIKHSLNKTKHIMTLPGDRKFYFRSMDNPSRIVAYEVYRSHVDEADLMNTIKKGEESWNRIIARTRQKWMKKNGKLHKKHFNMVSAYSTPESFKFTYKRWKKNPGVGYKYVVAPTRSNWNLSPSFIQNLQDTYTPAQCKAYLEGIWTNIFTGTVYSYYDREQHRTKRVIRKGDILHIGQDFNYGGCCGSVYVPFTLADKIMRFPDLKKQLKEQLKREHNVRKTADVDNLFAREMRKARVKQIGLQMVAEHATHDTEQLIQLVQGEYKKHRVIFFPDASAKSSSTNASVSDLAMIRQAGYEIKAKGSNPRIEDRINSVQRLLYNNRYFINDTTCPKCAESMEEHAFSETTGLPEKFKGPATIDDRMDGAGYCPAYLHPIKKVNITTSAIPI